MNQPDLVHCRCLDYAIPNKCFNAECKEEATLTRHAMEGEREYCYNCAQEYDRHARFVEELDKEVLASINLGLEHPSQSPTV